MGKKRTDGGNELSRALDEIANLELDTIKRAAHPTPETHERAALRFLMGQMTVISNTWASIGEDYGGPYIYYENASGDCASPAQIAEDALARAERVLEGRAHDDD